ncbi:MAG: anti-anti-sigma factor [Rhodanobacter sp.]|nr:MAG: anti-anti-sigma factor [Rhodanobacter sp.]TAL95635.1 MAG: anti-anti-sigma factor [Rhodanobacter sp.]TAM39133.1 MAG: anti-anti-sigma factor [Rhodanobacter sp.]
MNQAGMNQDARENLSAGMDGELPVEQLRFLLRRLDHDTSLRQAWSGYHLARDGLRRETALLASSGFAARVILAIEQESNVTNLVSRRHHWLRWSGGGVIAASVAAAALMISQPAGDPGRLDLSAHSGASPIAVTTGAIRPVAPPSVPPWLSGNSAGAISQQAAATLGAPLDSSQARNARQLSAYQAMHRYRTLDNNDGSYLLLLDPAKSGVPDASRQAGAGAQ